VFNTHIANWRDYADMFEGLLKLVGYEKRDSLLSQYGPELAAIFGVQATASGAAVTAETALRSPTTLACVRVISETIGALPIHLYERGTDNSRKRVTDHPTAKLLAGDWAPWASGADTRTTLQLDALLHGYGYGQIIRAGGRPKEVYRLDPRSTAIDWSGSEPFIKTGAKGQERRLDWRDAIVIATPGSAPGRQMCLLNCAREAIGVDLVMNEHQARLFSNGAKPSGVLKLGKKPLSPEAKLALQASWQALMGGAINSGKTVLLEDEMDWKQIAFSSVDSQFLELRRFVTGEIAKSFKVPPVLVGDLERAVWKNVEELGRQFLQMTLLPWLETWEGTLTRALLTPQERETMFLEFAVDDLMRADLVARFTAYRQAAGGAWLTPNEVRALENRPPIDGGDELILQAGQGGAEDPAVDPPKPLKAVA
jgi:HK97 family phage portal protein